MQWCQEDDTVWYANSLLRSTTHGFTTTIVLCCVYVSVPMHLTGSSGYQVCDASGVLIGTEVDSAMHDFLLRIRLLCLHMHPNGCRILDTHVSYTSQC